MIKKKLQPLIKYSSLISIKYDQQAKICLKKYHVHGNKEIDFDMLLINFSY